MDALAQIGDLNELLESIVPSIDGDLGIRVVSPINPVLFRVHFTIGAREYSAVGRSPAEAVFCAYGCCEELKKCSRCKTTRSVLLFPRRPGGKDGRMSHCLLCDRERKKKWYPRVNRPRRVS